MMGKPYNSFTDEENMELLAFSFRARAGNAPLSGYLAGKPRGGCQVTMLEEAWAEVFRVNHAIAVNSATSGLLAAAFAANLERGQRFVCPTMTMSATAAAPCFTGATPLFMDVEDEFFALDERHIGPAAENIRAIFVTNLFGHPARLAELRRYCDLHGMTMVEDNAQAPFATEGERYAGTIGHIGVFSLNIHKALQCGEGGIIVTDDDDLARRMRDFINHGEHNGPHLGLNLRMPELCAVVALTQLQRSHSIIGQRQEQAEAILAAIGFIPGLRPPVVRAGCSHVYYTIPFLIDRSRLKFCESLWADGVPVVMQYAMPLHRMPAFASWSGNHLPVADKLYDHRLFYIENCASTFTTKEIKQIGIAFRRAAESVNL